MKDIVAVGVHLLWPLQKRFILQVRSVRLFILVFTFNKRIQIFFFSIILVSPLLIVSQAAVVRVEERRKREVCSTIGDQEARQAIRTLDRR